MDVVKRAARGVGRVLRAVGREIAATIRFGAVPVSVDPGGLNQNVNTSGVAAGLGGLGNRNPDRGPDEEDSTRD